MTGWYLVGILQGISLGVSITSLLNWLRDRMDGAS